MICEATLQRASVDDPLGPNQPTQPRFSAGPAADEIRRKLAGLTLDPSQATRPATPERTSKRPFRSMLLAATLIAGGMIAGLAADRVLGGAEGKLAPPPAIIPPENQTTATDGAGLVASGYVVARRSATIGAQVTGQLQRILVSEGDVVKRGQVIAILDDLSADASWRGAVASGAAARSATDSLRVQRDEARRVLGRYEALKARGFVSLANLSDAQSRAASLDAQVLGSQANAVNAQAQVEAFRVTKDRYRVRAPFDGVVVAKSAEEGELVSPVTAGSGFTRTGIVTIVDMGSLGVDVDVSETNISRIKVGQRASLVLDSNPSHTFAAVVSAIVPTADRNKATVRVGLTINDADATVLPDMAAKVVFRTQQRPAL